MSKANYNTQAKILIDVIDIAIDSLIHNPPKVFEETHIKQFVNTYLDYKNKVINPESQFHNLTSLKLIKSDILTYFQESSGKAVDVFWKEINEKKLGIIRENRFEKLIKRGKIRNHIEYDMVIDLYNAYIETNMLSIMEIDKINDLISNFENKSNYKS
jgi:hypothetical protein